MAPTTPPPQTEQTIGDLLTAKGVSWAWYAGAWQAALAKRRYVDHTHWDTTSILCFVTKRYALPELAPLQACETALVAGGRAPPGDLTGALDLAQR